MSKKHIHKYHRIATKFQKLWKCGFSDCSHFMPSHLTEVIVGRDSICWGCGETFRLTPELMMRDRPLCSYCDIKETKGLDTKEIEKFLNEHID
jgi:hypothetical protein